MKRLVDAPVSHRRIAPPPAGSDLVRLAHRLNRMIEDGELAIMLCINADENACTFQPAIIADTQLTGLILVAKLKRNTNGDKLPKVKRNA